MENFRFFDLKVYPFADPKGAVAEVKAEARIKTTGRIYHQDYVLFLRAAAGWIAFLRECFDPVRAAKAQDTPTIGLESWGASGDGRKSVEALIFRRHRTVR